MIIPGLKRSKNEPDLTHLSYNKSQGETRHIDSFSEGVETMTPTGIAPYERQFGTDYSNLANLYSSRVSQPLSLETAPLFSNTLDPIVQNTLSRGIQDLKAKEAAGQRGMAANLAVAGTGENSALLSALNRQSQIANSGSINALYPSALEQQRGFDLQRQAMIQARNQEAMAARGQLINELSGGMTLLQALTQMAQIARGTRTKKVESSQETAGGTQSRSFF